MREIEVKARLQDVDSFLSEAAKLGVTFGEPFIQDDIIYETSTPKDDPNWNIFRIRKQNDEIVLTMKYKASTRKRDNHEREIKINDAIRAADILERIGYTRSVRIYKTRRIARHKDVELCLDTVRGLGNFIEVEKITDENADVDIVQAELWELLIQFGIHSEDRVYKGYDTLMHEHAAE